MVVNWKKHFSLSNIFFYLLLLAMIIPQSRKFIQVNVLRLLNFPPKIEEVNAPTLQPADLQLQLRSESGEIISLADLRDKGLFVNIWATWCPPCIAEMPSIDEFYSQASNDLHFIVASNEPIDKIKAFKQKNSYSFPIYQIISPLPRIMSESNSIPATYILSRDHKLIVQHYGAKNWANASFIKELKEKL